MLDLILFLLGLLLALAIILKIRLILYRRKIKNFYNNLIPGIRNIYKY